MSRTDKINQVRKLIEQDQPIQALRLMGTHSLEVGEVLAEVTSRWASRPKCVVILDPIDAGGVGLTCLNHGQIMGDGPGQVGWPEGHGITNEYTPESLLALANKHRDEAS